MADSAARMEALGLSEDDVANFKEAFATYDTESTGIINAAALASIMAALGFQNVSRGMPCRLSETGRDGQAARVAFNLTHD